MYYVLHVGTASKTLNIQYSDMCFNNSHNAPAVRTERMTGIPRSTVRNFAKQEKDLQLTPKKVPGRKSVKPEEWMLVDIRTIVRGEKHGKWINFDISCLNEMELT